MIHEKNRLDISHQPVLLLPRRVFLAVVFICLIFITSNLYKANGADSLGLRIDVLPNATVSASEPYAQNRRLWLVTSEAKPTTRTIRITSSVKNAQQISLQVASAKRIGDSTELDMERESEIKPWTTFSKESFNLPPFGQEEISVTVTPPKNLTDYSQDAFLLVKAGATKGPAVDKSRTTAVLSSQFQYATPIFYGVGNIENLMSIQIKDIDTYLDENGKYAEIEINNNGVGPVEINGDVQFTNLDFQTAKVGPILFSMSPLKPGKTGFATLRLPEQMVAGKWKVFIQAYVGSYGEAVVITKDFTFDYKQNSQLPRYLLFFLSFLILIFLLKTQRRIIQKSSRVNNSKTIKRNLSSNRFRTSNSLKYPRKIKDKGKLEDPEFTKWLDSLIASTQVTDMGAKSNDQKASNPAAKKSVKKSAGTSVAKKAAVKKSTAKKSTAKKSTAKKSTAKKSTAKKVTVQKK